MRGPEGRKREERSKATPQKKKVRVFALERISVISKGETLE